MKFPAMRMSQPPEFYDKTVKEAGAYVHFTLRRPHPLPPPADFPAFLKYMLEAGLERPA